MVGTMRLKVSTTRSTTLHEYLNVSLYSQGHMPFLFRTTGLLQRSFSCAILAHLPWTVPGIIRSSTSTTRILGDLAAEFGHILSSGSYKTSWSELHRVQTTLDSAHVVPNEATVTLPTGSWQDIMMRHGRSYTFQHSFCLDIMSFCYRS